MWVKTLQAQGEGYASLTDSIPAPLGGWNDRDPLADMPETDAIRMVNLFPGIGQVALRGGSREHADGMGGDVKTLAEHVSVAGVQKLIAYANGKIWDATTFGASATQLATGFTEDTWSTVVTSNVLISVNGQDQPQQYNGTAVSAANYTGIADDSALIHVTSYKGALYFIEINSASIWYGAVGSITGALTEFDVQSLLQRGGYLLASAPWTTDSGNGLASYFVTISSEGELLIYSGANPGDTEWVLVNQAVFPKPLGRRCLVRLGAELLVITEQGVIPLSSIFAQREEASFARFSDKVNNAFTSAAALYSSNFGWQGIVYPRGNYLAFNIPVSNDDADQYVVNTLTGAWCKFTGQPALCWCIHKDKLYFGTANNTIMQADYGFSDDEMPISVDLKTSFNYLGEREFRRAKQIHLVRPNIVANGDITLQFEADVDFGDQVIMDTVSVEGNVGLLWGEFTWATWTWGVSDVQNLDWYSVVGIGRAFAFRLRGEAEDLQLSLSSFDVIYQPAGYL